MSQEKNSESTYQLRAAVRASMSPAVWLLVLLQAAMLASMSLLGGNEETGPVAGFPIIFSLIIFSFIYLMSGLFRSFAIEENMISIPVALYHGKYAFTSFIWLMLRLLILFFLVTNILLVVSGAQPTEMIKEGAKTFALSVSLLSFVFIYWLPLVFTTNDFHLFKTLNTALLIAIDRIKQSVFLAFLVLLPATIMWMLPTDIPLPALVGIASVNEIATWIAYVYCIEYILRDKQRILVMLGHEPASLDAKKDDDTTQDNDKNDQGS